MINRTRKMMPMEWRIKSERRGVFVGRTGIGTPQYMQRTDERSAGTFRYP
jgi:hypothetical protein